MTSVAPILLFTYKRLETLKKTVSALQTNYLAEDSELYIFSDSAKSTEDEPIIIEVRNYIKSITGFSKINIIQTESNKGLANSIIDGVTKVLQDYESVIVLEDDLITTPNFLKFMNEALKNYKCANNVFSISGFSFNLGIDSENNSDAYFLNRGWSWGWATWKDRWEKVDWTMQDYKSFQYDIRSKRDFAKGGSDLNKMLRNQMKGKLDSWAIRWFYNQYRVGGLTLYPVYSKVYNNGFDAYATHTNGSSSRYQPIIDKKESLEFNFPLVVEVNSYYQKKFQKKMGILSRLKSKIESYFLHFTR